MKSPHLFLSTLLRTVLLACIIIIFVCPGHRIALGQHPYGEAVTTNSAFQHYPQIWGTNILWLDRRSGNSNEIRQGNWDIYVTTLPMYRITTSTRYP
ncbi:MAG: hypothetical protein NOU37_09665 [Candidatus Brocadiales bacterium]|nr:hypothetical protein [Candidatus Bathyanammoxibius amoris]